MLACTLALVLLMDVSGSVSQTNYEMQRDATAAALRDPTITRLVENQGGVAVTAMEWSWTQTTTVPWAVLRNVEDARGFADRLAATTRSHAGSTHMGEAIHAAIDRFEQAPCKAERMVIDISGDGGSNGGRPVEEARGRAMEVGIVVNGLPIRTPEEPDIVEYYRSSVATVGGFVMEADGWPGFRLAIRRKLALEIASR
ncbi:DUF1194 domain-containing protein [Roseomonas sp. SSH11]|uniref:DUF1194 domain-containing protein n=1 Tax=Pararoseomonas baculiformis TaxID=2820812 RepID=A0ABS4AHU3_9PROT|nr:DUF1194 domain-containing protein [Pararoseomonas baculiformis]MBP0446570.1 DUF1194 domain-containing protein [Pararoseomonas baculiformis]